MKKLLIVVLSVTMLFSITSCRQKVESPQEVSEKVLKAVSKLDVITLSRYLEVAKSKEDFDIDFSDFDRSDLKKAKLLLKHFDYEILSVTEAENKATVKTNITNIDLKYVFSQYVRQAIGLSISESNKEVREEKLDAALIKILEEDNIDLVTMEIDLKLNKIEDKWKVSLNETIKNTILESILNMGDIFNQSN